MDALQPILTFFLFFGGLMAIIVAAGVAFKRLERRPEADIGSQTELRELEARVAELEERVDFTERALTDVRERAQIPPKDV